jgi:hypothetical protein
MANILAADRSLRCGNDDLYNELSVSLYCSRTRWYASEKIIQVLVWLQRRQILGSRKMRLF